MKRNKIQQLLIIFILGFSLQGVAQSISDTSLVVNGVCGMCKNTIETAVNQLDGIKKAEWSVETKVLKLRYDSEKLVLTDVNKAVNEAGYDTEYSTGDEEAYQNLNPCCHYRDPKVVKDHQ